MRAFFNSILQIWQSLSIGQRVSMGGAVLFSVVILMVAVWWSQKPQMSLLYAKVDPSEAAKIADELRDMKIQYEISNGGQAIYVPNSAVYDLRLKLASKGIPRGGAGGGGVGFEIFDRQTFGLSDYLQKANYIRALQGELERTISRMEEVESARVLVVMPAERLFTAGERGEAKASVFLQLRSQTRLQRQQVNAIRFLVANGVEGLKPNRVAIVDNYGDVQAEDEADTGAALSSSNVEMRRLREAEYKNKIQTMLDQVLGAGQSVVRVTLDIDSQTLQKTEEIFDPATVVRSESQVSEESTTPIRSATATPGVANNVPGTETNSPIAGQVLEGRSKKQSINNQYDVGKVSQTVMKGPGDIKMVSIGVLVNQRLEGTGADRKPVRRSDEEIDVLKKVIQRAAGLVQEGKGKRTDQIEIQQAVFAIPEAPVVAAKPMWENLTWLLPVGKQVLLGALALAALLYFRHLLVGLRRDSLRADITVPTLTEAESAGAGEQVGGISAGELSKLIRENPTNISQMLKNWMAQE